MTRFLYSIGLRPYINTKGGMITLYYLNFIVQNVWYHYKSLICVSLNNTKALTTYICDGKRVMAKIHLIHLY